MQTTYLEPDVSLIYANGGLDRFGRVVNHSWMKDNDPLAHIIHGCDYAGNRTYRHDAVHAANSELYNYDQINQIKSLDRGVLNTNKDTVTVSNFTETWNFDKTGNWLQYDKNDTVENRTHNAANELQGIATHDANGNMTVMPGLKAKYDAWNRIVEVHDSSDNLIARYDYNGVNQRIQKTIGSSVTKSFFNEQWQELESVTDSELTTYVWGLRYIDDLILREKDAERLYSLADPNWNVVGIVDSTGTAQEHYQYDAFGKRTVLANDATPKTATDHAWNRAFTGQILDEETGQMNYRYRQYDTGLGRLTRRDPIKYWADDMNLYRYVKNSPLQFTDKYGLDITLETGNDGSWWDPIGAIINNNFHQQVCIDTWEGCDTDCPKKTGKKCFSYRQCGWNPFSGETYTRGPVSGAHITRKRETTCSEDMAYIAHIEVDQFSGGYGTSMNCRPYSTAVFDDAPGTEMQRICIKTETRRRWIPYPPPSSGGTFVNETICVEWDWVIP